MTSPSIQQTNPTTDISAVDLQTWAPALTEETESFPSYWSMKGWRCVIAVA